MGCSNCKEENKVLQEPKTLETVFGDDVNAPNSSLNTYTAMEESSEPENLILINPMLLSTVIRCVLKYLKMEDIKNCRLVCHEWGSTGKLALANRGRIDFVKHSNRPVRLPVEFQSCFLESATLFSAFRFSVWFADESVSEVSEVEGLTRFFEEHQKYIKELTLLVGGSEEKIRESINLSSWISISPMVQKNVKHMTKLSIRGGNTLNIPVHLIAHIKNLALWHCRINLEAGIQICPIKLKLRKTTFFQDGIKLDHFRINDFVDFRRAKKVSLDCTEEENTRYVIDLLGNTSVENLILKKVEIVNGETSQWAIEQLWMFGIPYSLNREMKIKELYLDCSGDIDLFTLSNSIQDLSLRITNNVTCSQPIVLGSLQYLNVEYLENDYSFLSHFMNCPQLTYLTLRNDGEMEMNFLWMPKSIKTLFLQNTVMKWVDESYFNLEKLVLKENVRQVMQLYQAKVRVMDDLFLWYFNMAVDEFLLTFLEYRKHFSFGKRLYLGEIKWRNTKLEERFLKEYVHVKSAFYVFENEEMGVALSKTAFHELVWPQ